MRLSLLTVSGLMSGSMATFAIIGWFAASPEPPTALETARLPIPERPLALRQPSESIKVLAAQFRAYAPEVAAPESAAEAHVEAEPDVAVLLRQAVSAVISEGGRLVLLVVDPNAPGSVRRLQRGSDFQQGWKIARIEAQTIELERGGEIRQVALYGEGDPGSLNREGDPASQKDEGDAGSLNREGGR